MKLFDKLLARLEKLNSRNRLRKRLRGMHLNPNVIDAFLRAFEPVVRRNKPTTMRKTSKGAGSLWTPDSPGAVHVCKGYLQKVHENGERTIIRARPKRDKDVSARQRKRSRRAGLRDACAA